MDAPCKCPPPGLPAYFGTFADLMSLLMCFFVLLLSFSEMDVLKFKQLAGSMAYAFGVQNKIEVKDIPKGTSVIALEFRPGRPDPTPIESIQQQTAEITEQSLEFQAGEEESAGGKLRQRGTERGGRTQSAEEQKAEMAQEQVEQQQVEQQQAQEKTNELAKQLAVQLESHIKSGALELESLGQQITIRIREKGSFSSGSAFLQPQFRPIVQQIADLLKDVPGEITVTGHSDDLPIESELFSSNWELSSQRAVAVAHEMIKVSGFEQNRLAVIGRGPSLPLVEGASEEARRQNRRVEISIMQGKPKQSDEIGVPAAQP
ncbi:MAG: flagellar motor protein MotB [Corallincola sp.]|nr:flagellar motor protein MotB [Corallincola sp.]